MLYEFRLWYPFGLPAPIHWKYIFDRLNDGVRMLWSDGGNTYINLPPNMVIDTTLLDGKKRSSTFNELDNNRAVTLEEVFPIAEMFHIESYGEAVLFVLQLNARLTLSVVLYFGLILGLHNNAINSVVFYIYTIFLPAYLWLYPQRKVTYPDEKAIHHSYFSFGESHEHKLRAIKGKEKSIYWKYFAYIRFSALVILDGLCGMSGFLPRAIQAILFFNIYFTSPTEVSKDIWDNYVKGFFSVLFNGLNFLASFIAFGDEASQNIGKSKPNASEKSEKYEKYEKSTSTIDEQTSNPKKPSNPEDQKKLDNKANPKDTISSEPSNVTNSFEKNINESIDSLNR
ncbi:hypothetical protein DI09_3p40 [Mitosporidium daphniae]|uniref:Uncharacterized protein n=1 Tax=Mitosporidium daphniae TaxID=1485682 RepID=A0A098VQB4_9MICR|nr:uncharacterized protein DI09_3p40 [Mitosporidium daphniae]KGG51242.1 hypothetical protein DI09_3p40 [Mitosporidium daphniae]|eukprot:XP_013237737.1 uncharacterized protein DI09_3p40 [Mitosporidium daphniae]